MQQKTVKGNKIKQKKQRKDDNMQQKIMKYNEM